MSMRKKIHTYYFLFLLSAFTCILLINSFRHFTVKSSDIKFNSQLTSISASNSDIFEILENDDEEDDSKGLSIHFEILQLNPLPTFQSKFFFYSPKIIFVPENLLILNRILRL